MPYLPGGRLFRTNTALSLVCPDFPKTPQRNSARASGSGPSAVSKKGGRTVALAPRERGLVLFDGGFDSGKAGGHGGNGVLLQGRRIAARRHFEVALRRGFESASYRGIHVGGALAGLGTGWRSADRAPAAATAIAGSAVDSEERVPKQYPKGKPPLAFYALSRPKAAESGKIVLLEATFPTACKCLRGRHLQWTLRHQNARNQAVRRSTGGGKISQGAVAATRGRSRKWGNSDAAHTQMDCVGALAGNSAPSCADRVPARPSHRADHSPHRKSHKAQTPLVLPPLPSGPLSQLPMDQIPATPAKVSYQGGLLTISAQNST